MAGKGNPRRWRSAKALQAAVDAYFEECSEKGRVPSVAGLALALGFMSRQALYRYTRLWKKSVQSTARKSLLPVPPNLCPPDDGRPATGRNPFGGRGNPQKGGCPRGLQQR